MTLLAGLLASLPLLLPRSPIHSPTHTTALVRHVQGQFLEIEAAMVALAACWVHPLPSLNRHRPQQRISDGYGLALLASMACCLQLAQLLMMALLRIRPWFQGGLGTSSWVSICTSWCITYLAKHCDALRVVLPSHVRCLRTYCALHGSADAALLRHCMCLHMPVFFKNCTLMLCQTASL